MNSKDLPMVFLTSGGVNSVCLSIVIIDIGLCYPLVFWLQPLLQQRKPGSRNGRRDTTSNEITGNN